MVRAERHHGRRDVTFGTLLQRDLNTRLHFSDNGRALDDLLTAVIDPWPVPVQDVVLIGIIAGFPVAVEVLPAHVPLLAKIRTELLDPTEGDYEPRPADGPRAEDL